MDESADIVFEGVEYHEHLFFDAECLDAIVGVVELATQREQVLELAGGHFAPLVPVDYAVQSVEPPEHDQHSLVEVEATGQ